MKTIIEILEDYYNKMEKKNMIIPQKDAGDVSLFFQDMYFLVCATAKLLEKKRPRIRGDLWLERTWQIKILMQSLKNAVAERELLTHLLNPEAGPVPVPDESLLKDFLFIRQNYSEATFPSKYNEFSERLNDIFDKLDPSHLNLILFINLDNIRKEIQREEREKIKHIIRQAELIYLQKLSENPVLDQLIVKLNEISGQEVLAQILEIIRNQASIELMNIKEEYQSGLEEILENEKTKDEIFGALLEKFRETVEILTLFFNHFPTAYEKFSKNFKIGPLSLEAGSDEEEEGPKKKLSDKKVAKLLPAFYIFSGEMKVPSIVLKKKSVSFVEHEEHGELYRIQF